MSLHHDEKDGLFVENGTQIWYSCGKIHRDEKDENGRLLPALIENTGTKMWYSHGKIHRNEFIEEENCYLPAVIRIDDFSITKEWWFEGNLHSYVSPLTGEDFPGSIYQTKNGATVIKTWYSHGVIHREKYDPVTDLHEPAITSECPFAEISSQSHEVYKNGVRQSYKSPITGKYTPSSLNAQQGAVYVGWSENGKTHSFDDQPAFISFTELKTCKIWYHHGVRYHREMNDRRKEQLPAMVVLPGHSCFQTAPKVHTEYYSCPNITMDILKKILIENKNFTH